jgi:hypothetical protein
MPAKRYATAEVEIPCLVDTPVNLQTLDLVVVRVKHAICSVSMKKCASFPQCMLVKCEKLS